MNPEVIFFLTTLVVVVGSVAFVAGMSALAKKYKRRKTGIFARPKKVDLVKEPDVDDAH